jgi:hypothetical protein
MNCGLSVLLFAVVAAAHQLEIETFVADDLITVKIATIHGLSRNMVLSMDGRVSTCDIATENAAFVDVTGMMIRPLMNYNALSGCEMDLMFLFTRYRQVILSHNSIIFTEDPLEGGHACMRDTTTRGLCETRAGGVTLRWFSDQHLYYENAGEVDALGVVLPPASWSVRSTEPIVDVNESYLVARVDVHYDRTSHTIALRPRMPSLGLKIATSLAAALVAFFFVTRLLLETTWRHTALHAIMLSTGTLTTILSLSTRANGMKSIFFLLSSAVVTAAHLVIESIRWWQKSHASKAQINRRDPGTHVLLYIDLKPDLALLMVALILSFYAITSHSLIVIPTLLVMLFIVKTLAEFFNLRSLRPLRGVRGHRVDVYLLVACLITDLYYSVVLWRYIVGDFLRMTLVSAWYLQEILLLVVLLDAALYVAVITDNALRASCVAFMEAHPE